MSHDNRFSKTNYLKTNLLKQIKKNIFIDLTVGITFPFRLQRYKKSVLAPNNFAIFCISIAKKTKNRDNSLRITPICYFKIAKLHSITSYRPYLELQQVQLELALVYQPIRTLLSGTDQR